MEKECKNIANPQSLLYQCTEMVASHLDLVESFVGLPSLIGEQIFKAGCHSDRFKFDMEYSMQSVRLFTDAYGDQFLSSLNVSGEHLGLNYSLEQILLFKDLVQLDVSNCGLGDDHEILAQFQNLNRLEEFLLRGNVVSNTGVQKMTTPYRMFSRGPAGLQRLDLRDNGEITKNCLKYLSKFEFLNTVAFSELHNQKEEPYGCWTLVNGNLDLNIETVGWAKVLIDRWMLQARQKSVKPKPKPKTGAFSIRKCLQDCTSTVSSSSHDAGNQQYCDVIAKRLNISLSETVSRSKTNVNHSNKRQLDSEKGNIDCYRNEMEGILNVYRKHSDLNNTETPSFQTLDLCDRNQFSLGKSTGQAVTHSNDDKGKTSELKQKETLKDDGSKTDNFNPFKVSSRTDLDVQGITKHQRKIYSNVSNGKVKRHTSGISWIQGQNQSLKGSGDRMQDCIKSTVLNNTKISKFFTKAQSKCGHTEPQYNNQSNVSKHYLTNNFNQSSLNISNTRSNKDASLIPEGVAVPVLRPNSSQSAGKSKKRKRIVIKQKTEIKALYSNKSDKSVRDSENVESQDSNDEDLDSDIKQKTKKLKSSLIQSLDMCF